MQNSNKKETNPKKGLSKLADAVLITSLNENLKKKVNERIREFEQLRRNGSDEEWFSELCFCIMTANSTAKLGIKIQEALGGGCIDMDPSEVRSLLTKHGHRFARPRSDYICKARAHKDIKSIVESHKDGRSARDWIVENILGLGYKEASHFLRNTGHFDVAILDRHILRIMEEYSLIQQIPKTLTRKRYLEIESILDELSEKVGIPPGILDFYLWYMKTGEILK